MKKILLLGCAVLTIISCERTVESVAEVNEQQLKTNENFSKKTADSAIISTTQTTQPGPEPIEGLDPKDITPPRR